LGLTVRFVMAAVICHGKEEGEMDYYITAKQGYIKIGFRMKDQKDMRAVVISAKQTAAGVFGISEHQSLEMQILEEPVPENLL
jgi:N-acetylglutamate synthase/N-acetylornithine aminotransferase